MRFSIWLIAFATALLAGGGAALAYPEFQKSSQETSGRHVSCAMCHAHPDGPEGVKAGQVGSLDPEALERLNTARAALEPGHVVDSPILNEFGNSIVEQLGKKQILLLRQEPVRLSELLGDGDLDGDGITDATELREGTHPLNPYHGNPWTLFLINLQRFGFHIVMLVLATGLGLYGLGHLIRWFAHEARRALGETERR